MIKERTAEMLIEFTQEEQRHIQDIQAEYAPERASLQQEIEKARAAGAGREELLKLHTKQQALLDRLQEELEAFSNKCQRERFVEISAAGAAAIIAHAKEQAPVILEYIHRETEKEYGGFSSETLTKTRIGTAKHGTLFINANYATGWLKEELKLHIEALMENKPALQELLEAIIEAVEASPYTDSEEITDKTEKPVEVMRFRRSPLTDITTYGLMNDRANTQLIQDGGIFQTNPDGQMQLLWSVNQAPQDQDQVPVYIALTYDGIESGLSRKLSTYDSAVYNAVSDLFYYWKRENPQKPLYITPQEIWRRMNGKQNRDGSAKPSATQIKKISRSIDKMRHVDFLMDISKEINAHYITLEDERLVGGYIKDYLLNCSEAGFYTEQGRKVKGYRINYEPVLYTYNAAKNHVLYLPFDLLDTSSALSDSENVTEFKQYLLQQILLMKNGVRSNHKILLSTIYKATGLQPPEERLEEQERLKKRQFKSDDSKQAVIRRLRKADKDKIEGLLEAWKTKKWIKDYTPLNSNGKPVGKRQAVAAYDIRI